MGRISQDLDALDAECNAREEELKQRIAELEAANVESTRLLLKTTKLLSRRTLAVGFLISYLRVQGLDREQIDALAHGTLDLEQESTCEK